MLPLLKFLKGFDFSKANMLRNLAPTVKNVAAMGDDVARYAPSMAQSAKSIALWGGAGVAGIYGIQQLTNRDAASQEADFQEWLNQNPSPTAVQDEYRNYYQAIASPYNEGPKATTTFMMFDTAEAKSVQINQWREARSKSGNLSYSALYQKQAQYMRQRGL